MSMAEQQPAATRCASLVLVVGGARSGKSAYAERLVEASGRACVYVASGQAFDGEMQERIGQHQSRRGAQWRTVEEPLDLAGVVARESAAETCLLIDCLTLWTSNLMHAGCELDTAANELCAALLRARGPVVLVSNEVGLGIVPENKLARRFRDEAGRINQQVANACDTVMFMASGQALQLKPSLNPEIRL
ncbi:bifunctional adenosylcobinamide kinase/adenosylcobinamide-phosphate guanylyltransferase [Polycladidibacter hongkongensis]|uniref:bifunctional adenosylcobinamide kinase/adenosylcobinamide-phosphate guanylyltransferase n=1 Tax=Polycladidibacter hongkongensis TaxID=1647556 RepID=UPI000829B9C6|nr:bifunctional adenosylcobinamide kinase/adenosylcobinamide-phosphate guanylyltransferase [Pseudovibrio hongkongensis]